MLHRVLMLSWRILKVPFTFIASGIIWILLKLNILDLD